MIDGIADKKFVLDLDKTHTIEFIIKRRREIAFLHYSTVRVGNFLQTFGARLLAQFQGSRITDPGR
jgi:hypothetical protein